MRTLSSLILTAAFCLGSSFAHAVQEGHGGGAGHTYFVSIAYDLIQALKNPRMQPTLAKLNVSVSVISQDFDPSKVLVTTDQLMDDLGNQVDALVINNGQIHIIKINKVSWDNFQEENDDVRMLVLKELLRFAGYDHGNEAIEKAKIILSEIDAMNKKLTPLEIVATNRAVLELVNAIIQVQDLNCDFPHLASFMDGIGGNQYEIQYRCTPQNNRKANSQITVTGGLIGTRVTISSFTLENDPL